MILDKDLASILPKLVEGEMFLAGHVLKGLSQENISWVVIESEDLPTGMRVTLHAYWHGIFMVSKVVTVTEGGNLVWGVTKA